MSHNVQCYLISTPKCLSLTAGCTDGSIPAFTNQRCQCRANQNLKSQVMSDQHAKHSFPSLKGKDETRLIRTPGLGVNVTSI